MLFVHKMIDAALGRDERSRFIVNKGTAPNTTTNLLRAAAEAEKFDFGQLVLEKKDNGLYSLPDLTEAEKEMWVTGFIPLPAEICWFEYQIGEHRNALCVLETLPENPDYKIPATEKHPWIVMRVDYRNGNQFSWDGNLAAIHRVDQDWTADSWQYVHGGNKHNDITDDVFQRSIAADVMLSIYLALRLNSRTTEIRHVVAPDKLNKQRSKKGLTALSAHRIVNIVPVRYLHDAERDAQGTHASPRLHWRSSHIRTMPNHTPKTRLAPDGTWKMLIARQLIGLAENGSVSHEYRVTWNGKTLH